MHPAQIEFEGERSFKPRSSSFSFQTGENRRRKAWLYLILATSGFVFSFVAICSAVFAYVSIDQKT